LKFPSEDEIKKINFKTESELGYHFDTEFEIGLQFTDEIIPYALEFFLGVAEDKNEYPDYVNEQKDK
jgi:hypothetical protein